MSGVGYLAGAVPPASAASLAAARPRAEQRIISLTFWLFWLMIFEGAIRKWLVPELHQYVIFVRDPLAAVTYVLAFARGRVAHRALWAVTLAVTTLIALAAVIQVVATTAPLAAIVYGVRNYLFFIPLAFVIGTYFTRSDFHRLLRQVMLVSVPLAVLALVQFNSPSASLINKGLGDGVVFTVVGDIVRTYGTFTFTSGQSLYVALLLAMVCSAFAEGLHRTPRGRLLVGAGLAAVAATLLTSGSRSAIFLSAIVLVTFTLGQTVAAGGHRRGSYLAPFLVPALLAFAAIFVFDRAVGALAERQSEALYVEGSTLSRAIGSVTSFVDALGDAEPLGAGIGTGTNAGATIILGAREFRLGEDELSRNVRELGPLFGSLFLAFRFVLAGYVAIMALRSLFRFGDASPAILGSLAFALLVSQQVTFQNTTNYFTWMTLGLTLALLRAPARALP